MNQLHGLLLVLVAFCTAVGWGVFHFGGSAWSIAIFTLAAIFALQLSYIAAVLVESFL